MGLMFTVAPSVSPPQSLSGRGAPVGRGCLFQWLIPARPEDRVTNCPGLPETKALLREFHDKHQESPVKTRMRVSTTGKLFKKYECPPPTQEGTQHLRGRDICGNFKSKQD